MGNKAQTISKIMDEGYWDKIAADYDGEIFSVFGNDREEMIASKIREFGSKEGTACDFGCGVGKFLPIMSKNFGRVYAVDLSSKLLSQARENCEKLKNISYIKEDLSKAGVKVGAVDFALSVSVAIMPSTVKRSGIFKTITKHLRKGGHLLLVVPSLESALYTDFRLVQWNMRSGWTVDEAVLELEEADEGGASLRQGLVEIEGVPTKHYLQEELLAMFEGGALEIVSVDKIEYSWKTEFDGPPRWMSEPYPWDWMVVLRKT
ncbi:MAG: class I SAM-dependent methyltransferase [Planctomycetota bacterium]|jgi:SAM-dependent methyltransferase